MHLIRDLDLSAIDLLRALLSLPAESRVNILDSGGARDQSSRYLIAGFDPCETIETGAGEVTVVGKGERRTAPLEGTAPDLLDKLLAGYFSPDSPRARACIASFAYELGHDLERLHLKSDRRVPTEPDMFLAFFETLAIHDYSNGSSMLVTSGGEALLDKASEALHAALKGSTEVYDVDPLAAESPASNFSRDAYLAAVLRIKRYIEIGDVYQANLTQQFTCRLNSRTSPEGIFWRLRRDHPASFAAFIRRSEDVVISASPERFLRASATGSDRRIEAWPIKGTRPRGATPGEDARLRAELLASEKDRAENIMIVDLLRNDLGRVSRYGSVEVAEVCALQEHPTLFHLVSKVRATLRDDVTAGAILRACFPCGSVTGAPKIRAMEIINEIETVPRGLSMGAIGYFCGDGSIDLNVAIRTMVVRDQVATFNVGGGIVADSSPSLEYDESLLKARALLRAIGVKP